MDSKRLAIKIDTRLLRASAQERKEKRTDDLVLVINIDRTRVKHK